MRTKLILLYLIFFDFVAFSAYVIYSEGYFAFLAVGFAGLWSTQITLDLVIACLLICTWILADAKARGVTAWPYVLATVFIGSIAPLWYLIRREHARGDGEAVPVPV